MSKNIHLLVIDPQNDFCDLPSSYWPVNPLHADQRIKPQLAVPGAHADMHRLAQFIRNGKHLISNITITLDSHHHVGIERPTMWVKPDGTSPEPFTQLKAEDVRSGRVFPKSSTDKKRVLNYLDKLEAAGRYTHMIWPIHCEIGTWGHNIHADVLAACNVWEVYAGKPTSKVIKGTNPYTEHYSALIAEVPDPDDPQTQLNSSLLASMQNSDVLLVAGEAGSHCVKSTLEHYLEYANEEYISRVVVLTDCMSPITGFEQDYQEFLDKLESRGATLTTAALWLSQNRE